MARIVKPKYTAKFPISTEREYQKLVRGFVREMAAVVNQSKKQIVSLIQKHSIKWDTDLSDLPDTGLDMAIEVLTTSIAEQYAYKMSKRIIRDKVRQIFDRVNKFNNKEYQKTMKSALGVDIFVSEPWLNQAAGVWVRENVRLIKSVETQYFDKIESMITGAVKDGAMTKDIAKQIQDITSVSERRANVIARDQIGKLNGQLTRYRQKGIGINRYRWSTSGDRRVRPAHRERAGKDYSWDDPPMGGHPGEAVMCRCTAIAVIDLDSIGYVAQPAPQGLSSGDNYHGVPRHDPPRLVGTLDPTNTSLIKSKLKEFEKQVVDSPIEKAMVVTRTGKVYHCKGTTDQVFVDDLGEELRGASVTHNHPKDETEYSFSNEDFNLFRSYELKTLRGADEKYVYELSRNVLDIDSEAPFMAEDSYQHNIIIQRAKQAGIGYRRQKRG